MKKYIINCNPFAMLQIPNQLIHSSNTYRITILLEDDQKHNHEDRLLFDRQFKAIEIAKCVRMLK